MTSLKKPSIKNIKREIGNKYLQDLLQSNKEKKNLIIRQMGEDHKEFKKGKPISFQLMKDTQLNS